MSIEWLKSFEGQDTLNKLYYHGLNTLIDKESIILLLNKFPQLSYKGLAYRARFVTQSNFIYGSLEAWDYSFANISWSKNENSWDSFIDECISLYNEHIFFDVWKADVIGLDLNKLFILLSNENIYTLEKFKASYAHEEEILVIEYSNLKKDFSGDRGED